MDNIPHGRDPGTFGWLSWDGNQSANTLAQSLTPPGNSERYVNPHTPADTSLSPGDWVQGRPTTSNALAIREALGMLKGQSIALPLWEEASGQGGNLHYRITGVVQVQITDYQLAGKNLLSLRYLGPASCTLQP